MSVVCCLLSFPWQSYVLSLNKTSKSTPNYSQIIKIFQTWEHLGVIFFGRNTKTT